MEDLARRTQFTFYESYETGAKEHLKSAEDKAQWYEAIIRAALYGERPRFEGEKAEVLDAMWSQVEPHLLSGRTRSIRAKGNQNARKKPLKAEELKEVPETVPKPEKEPEPVKEPEEEPEPVKEEPEEQKAPALPPRVSPFAEFGL